MPHPDKKPNQRRNSVSREDLLAAALQEFLSHGFQAARIDDIARLAGVGKGSVYLHFKTKEDLFEAVIDDGVGARLAQAENLAGEFAGSATELLGTMLHNNLIEFWDSPSSAIPKLVVAESQRFPDIAANYHRKIISRARTLIESILKLGIAQGEYRDIDVSYTARLILDALDNEIILAHAYSEPDHSQFDAHRFINALLDMVTQGIQRNPKSPDSAQLPSRGNN